MKPGGHRERIHPDGRTLFGECPVCRTRTVFFMNPATDWKRAQRFDLRSDGEMATLKNQGYNFGHNYGLGKKNLSAVFTILMMLALISFTYNVPWRSLF